jgi:hypothetical protein
MGPRLVSEVELMILHRGDRERSQHKPYVIEWERDRRDVVASFDTLSEGIIGYS